MLFFFIENAISLILKTMKLYHHFIDIENKNIFPACVEIKNGKINNITKTDLPCEGYILPGFIDAHIHIESSMLLPSEFARIAVKHGTIGTVSDPHEIANVLGIKGVEFMLDNAAKVPFKFHFGAPSCVPATSFETAGANIDANDIETLLQRNDIYYLSEMMNYPGVLSNDKEVMQKIAISKKLKKPIDGHAPGLRGLDAQKYIDAGISTDHECFTKEEAEEKLKMGMKILIREGSAAKNFEALYPLIEEHYMNMMFCCDDKHPDELEFHHINHHVKRSLDLGIDLFKVLQMACINPIKHYQLNIGQMKIGDDADFIIIDNINNFNILKTAINGNFVFENGLTTIESIEETALNHFNCEKKKVSDFKIEVNQQIEKIKVIEAIEGQLITQTIYAEPLIQDGNIISNIENDILKIAVVNRYSNQKVATAFIKNFNLKEGAIASTVAHDSHNIICVGCSDEEICEAVNELIQTKGGIAVVSKYKKEILPLDIAGLMSTQKVEYVSNQYTQINTAAQSIGCTLHAPFMTLSFMALLVIPQLKLSAKGLFDGNSFSFTELY